MNKMSQQPRSPKFEYSKKKQTKCDKKQFSKNKLRECPEKKIDIEQQLAELKKENTKLQKEIGIVKMERSQLNNYKLLIEGRKKQFLKTMDIIIEKLINSGQLVLFGGAIRNSIRDNQLTNYQLSDEDDNFGIRCNSDLDFYLLDNNNLSQKKSKIKNILRGYGRIKINRQPDRYDFGFGHFQIELTTPDGIILNIDILIEDPPCQCFFTCCMLEMHTDDMVKVRYVPKNDMDVRDYSTVNKLRLLTMYIDDIVHNRLRCVSFFSFEIPHDALERKTRFRKFSKFLLRLSKMVDKHYFEIDQRDETLRQLSLISQSEERCIICSEDDGEESNNFLYIKLNCAHIFHVKCLGTQIKESTRSARLCSLCRAPIVFICGRKDQ